MPQRTEQPQQQPTFHLGLTMAGAVSAGAYTAGVVDYLLEALETWEKYKLDAHPTIPVPKHQVKIEVVGGASAGGVTAALMALAAKVGIEPVREEDYDAACEVDFKPNNLLFEAWVNMVDEKEKVDTFKQMLGTGDIVGSQVPSLLNSQVIDEIANKALKEVEAKWGKGQNLPAYIAEDLDVLLTLCSLKGIPMGIDFDTDIEGNQKIKPSYQMQTHKLLARFNYQSQQSEGNPDKEEDLAYGLESRSIRKRLIACAKSTAAFPIGLAAQPLEGMSKRYLMQQFATFGELKAEVLERIFEGLENPFNSMSIDGGTLNNEPFGETETLLKKGNKEVPPHSGIVLIDPFPNFSEPVEESASAAQNPEQEKKPANTLDALLSPIFSTLIHQGRFKEQDLESITKSRRGAKKNMIFPSRRNEQRQKVEGNHLACGALNGFSGFINRQFRVHDFFLGRKNCRNFLRFFFVLEYKKGEPVPELFSNWPKKAIKYFQIKHPDKKGYYQLPIIPCFDFMEELERKKSEYPDKKQRELNWIVGHPTPPFAFPQLAANDLINDYEGDLKARARAILDAMDERLKTEPKKNTGTAAQQESDAQWKDFWTKRFKTKPLGKCFSKLAKGVLMGVAPKLVARNVLKVLLKDLGRSGLVKW